MNILLWLRQDLRLEDNPALQAALSEKPKTLTFIYVLPESLGAASRWWLHHSLMAFQASLKKYGQTLFLSNEPEAQLIPRLIEKHKIQALYCSQRYEPDLIAADKKLFHALQHAGISVKSFPGYLMHDPTKVLTGQGKYYQKYTPFWRTCYRILSDTPLTQQLSKAPTTLPASLSLNNEKNLITVNKLASWELCPKNPNWASGFEKVWVPGEDAAQKKLKNFLKFSARQYDIKRDYPAEIGTSHLSPHLHFGEISAYRIYRLALSQDIEDTFIKELMWREFCYHLLYHFPALPQKPLNPLFAHFPWHSNKKAWLAWTRGETGYPIVDAGMRELWTTGVMHNRVRMIVASFLVKDLFIPWQSGAAWFLDTLVDADLASNSANWQWVAGCGADAAPYFRIFNPALQSKKFDSEGLYIKKWLPELQALSASEVHEPWLSNQVNRLHYPKPIVNHAEVRQKALGYYQQLKAKYPR
jgi:deoxyribodipyrimidine photo-lyase